MLRSIILAGTIALGLAACTPTTPASPELADEIAMVLGNARADIGEDIGGGAILRSANNNGDTLVFGFTLAPFLQTAYDLDPDLFVSEFIAGMTSDICRAPGMGRFLSNGGAIRMEFFSASGTPLRAFTVSDCPS